jgi:hypothetical protein
MHLSGDYVSNSSEFSSSKWLQTTDLYINKIKNDLTSENWTAIFQALHHLRKLCKGQADRGQGSSDSKST